MFKMLKRILNVCGNHKKRVYGGVVCSILNAAFNSLSILALLNILIHINELTTQVILLSIKILIASLIGKAILKYLVNSFLSASGYIVFCDQRLELGDKLQRAPMGYFSEKNLGQINNTVTTAMSDLEMFAMMAVENVIGGALQGVLVAVFLMYFDWRLGMVTIIGLLLSLWALSFIQKRAATLTPIRNATLSKIVDATLSFIRGISVVKSFGLKEDNSLHQAFEEYASACIDLEKQIMGPQGLFKGLLDVSSCSILLMTSLLMLYGELSFTVGVMFLVSSFMIYGQMEMLGNGAFLMQLLGDCFDRMDETYNVPEMGGQSGLLPVDQTIEVDNVTFAYDKRQVLKNVSFKVPAKSSLAIVGYSGSGKTTLCNLLLRFWDVDKGTIRYGGNDIKTYKTDTLLSQFAMVFQNVYLFNDTIENNIRFGCPEMSYESVVQAAKRACCHEFIIGLPQGYQTVIGEGGSTLSGGEKQRISIARAILKDAPVVILDEATSSVDPENEFELMQAIESLTRGKTLITIAHRMATVRNADQIIVMKDGCIVQKGTHDLLVKEEGVYKKFLKVRQQSEGWSLST
jgi:ATP-binding cassette subfamily B protein